jgi:TDG/mug DNA glycosylase family protein
MRADLKPANRCRPPQASVRKPRLLSFSAVSSPESHTLILGSMPGAESLRAGEYYAHPRNAFWHIMGELFGATPGLPYTPRLRRLTDAGIALWDALAECHRTGSLDAAIDRQSAVANDLPSFLREHPKIGRIFFNGASAERYFHRYVAKSLALEHYTIQRLPSTSPALAAVPYAAKRDAWRILSNTVTR